MNAPLAAQRLPQDTELALGIAARDDRSFEKVMRVHNRMLYRLARSILKDDADAEDALQEAYLAAYRNIGSFRGDARLATWLARIVINESYARLRQRSRAEVVPLGAAAVGDADESRLGEGTMVDDAVERPDNAAMRSELRRILERQIDALPEQFRTVFVLREVEEMSVEDTAECLGVAPATVRTRAFRARALLRETLSREIDAATVNAFGFAGERCDRIVASVLKRMRFLNH